MPSFDELTRFLDSLFVGEAYRGLDDPHGPWRPGTGHVAAIGLLLEANDETARWVAEEALDVLIVHRPWGLPDALPGDPGVLAYHLAFDERLTVGMNALLADSLGMSGLESLGQKDGRPLGMIGAMEPRPLGEVAALIEREFGRVVLVPAGTGGAIQRLAVVGAMWPELVAEAADRGAHLYVTGDLRRRGVLSAETAGISVASVGHRAAEVWGLRALQAMIEERFSDARVVLAPEVSARPEMERSAQSG